MKKRVEIRARPRKAAVKDRQINIYVSQAQHVVIRIKAEKAGMPIAAYIREMAVQGELKERWSEADRHCFKKLVGLSNDLHSVVQIAEREGILHAMLYFTRLRDLIDAAMPGQTNNK